MRAYDWLASNGVDVPGYDPLADRAARIAALRAWAEAESAAEAGSEPGDGP